MSVLYEHADYRSYLKKVLADRVARNPSYSLRAFASQIGVHHSTLVQVFQKKKRISVDRGHGIAHRLDLKDREYEYFCLLVAHDNAKTPELRARIASRMKEIAPSAGVLELEVERFQFMAEWYHMPILQMTEQRRLPFTPAAVAKRLGIKTFEAESAIERLKALGLIALGRDGRYEKTDARVVVSAKETRAAALRSFHRQMLEKALKSLDSQSPQEKWVGSETFCFDESKLKEAGAILEECFNRLVQLADRGEKGEHVFHLNTCLFRLTEKSPSRRKSP